MSLKDQASDNLTRFLLSRKYELFGSFLRRRQPLDENDLICETRRIADFLRSKKSNLSVVSGAGSILGLISSSSSPWDSRVLGWHTARINHFLSSPRLAEGRAESLLQDSLDVLKSGGHKLVIARVPLIGREAVRALCLKGALTDILLTFRTELNKAKHRRSPVSNLRIGFASEADKVDLRKTSLSAFREGHFHSDPRIKKASADLVYGEIVSEQMQSKKWDVARAQVGGQFAGLITFTTTEFGRRLKYGQISLLAVAPEYRRTGVARALVQFAGGCLKEKGVNEVHVSTQASNFAAIALYESEGFVNVNSWCTFHIWLD